MVKSASIRSSLLSSPNMFGFSPYVRINVKVNLTLSSITLPPPPYSTVLMRKWPTKFRAFKAKSEPTNSFLAKLERREKKKTKEVHLKKKSGFSFLFCHPGDLKGVLQFPEKQAAATRSPGWQNKKLKPDFFLKCTSWTTCIPTLSWNFQKQRIFITSLIWQKRTFSLPEKSYGANLENKFQIYS